MIDFKEHFYYDVSSESGLRRLRDVWCGRYRNVLITKKDAIAGGSTGKYWAVSVYNKKYLVHVVIWNIFNGSIPLGMDIDHIDGNGLNNKLENLRLVTRSGNARNCRRRKDNASGTVGVNLYERFRGEALEQTWRAEWVNYSGRKKSRSFSTKKYGYDEAFRLACEWRQKMILELNAQGAGYTERHGK